MKTGQPFYGVARPKLNAALCNEMRLRFVPADRAAYERGVIALWRLPHREEQYAAIEYARRVRTPQGLEACSQSGLLRPARPVGFQLSSACFSPIVIPRSYD